jgi:hypothetical protein
MVTYEIETETKECNTDKHLILSFEGSGKDVLITATDNRGVSWYIARFTSDGCLRLSKNLSDTIGLTLDEQNRITIVD